MKKVVEPIKHKETLSLIEKYLDKVNLRDRVIFALGCNTGLRISDILNLNIEDVKNKTFIELKEQKTNKYKKIFLNDKLQKLIKEYLIKRENNYTISNKNALFIGKKHKRLNRSQVYRTLNNTCKNLGLKTNIGTHTMRKTFGYFFYKQFNDIALLQKILNHSNPIITLRYIGIDQDEIDYSYKNFEI